MNIVFVAAEAYPFAKVGGLGDVVGALPPVLANRGHSVNVVIPGYRSTWRFKTEPVLDLNSIAVALGSRILECTVRRWQSPAQPRHAVYFIDNPEYFGQRHVYCDEQGVPYPDNPERFLFFQKAVLKMMTHLDWRPNIIHCHDNHTALIPVYLKTTLAGESQFLSTKSILTLHNIAYQGDCAMQLSDSCDLPEDLFAPNRALVWYGRINPVKGGIVFADAVTTVSPTHAREIMSDVALSAGLNGIISARQSPVLGILNGIDTSEWNPESDERLSAPYSAGNLAGKKINKLRLIEELHLNPVLISRPLIGLVTRLVEQKGIDLLISGLGKILDAGAGFVMVGSGDQNYQNALSRLAAQYPDRMAIEFSYNNPLAHRIIAASDMFLMPSRFEPCGITQMYALRYGTVPIVHYTGGLADTVRPWNGKTGNGFAFRSYQPEAMLQAVFEAAQVYERPDEWQIIIINGMTADYSWDRAATSYTDLYEKLINNN